MRVGGSAGASVAASSADGDVVSVGSCQLKAFQVALKTMKEGEKVTLHIKPECTGPPFCFALYLCLHTTNRMQELLHW